MAKYTIQDLNDTLQAFVDDKKIPGGVLIVNKHGREVFRGKWGYADPAKGIPADYTTIYRLASMSKVITAIAVMQLVEQGKVNLEDSLSKYLPEYANPVVFTKYIWGDGTYAPDDTYPAGMTIGEVTGKVLNTPPIPADREIQIRDLMSHSAGIGMGNAGATVCYGSLDAADNLAARVKKWGNVPLDFQPGTDTGYSALMGFDILSRIVEVVSGMPYDRYLKKYVFDPMGIQDICFVPDEEQKQRIGKRYFVENGKLYWGTDTDNEIIYHLMELGMNAEISGAFSGATGLWGTAEDYNRIALMLANEGEYNGYRVLKTESVQRMHQQAAQKYMEPVAVGQAGCVWGLGVIIFQDAAKMNAYPPKGTFGWNGAFGTDMLVEPKSGLTLTFMTNVTNSGGNLSPVSNKVEELVLDIWG